MRNPFRKQKNIQYNWKNNENDIQASVLNSFIDAVSGNVNKVSDRELLNFYLINPYVFRAVRLISDTASSLPFQLLSIRNANGETEEVLNSPALDVLRTDPYSPSIASLFKRHYTYALLTGKSYWLMEDNTIELLRPDLVKPEISRTTGDVMFYRVRKEGVGTDRRVEVDDIIAFKDTDPTDRNSGVSASQPSRLRILLDNKVAQYHNSLLSNGAVPSKIISPKDIKDTKASPQEIEDYNRKFNRMFQGVFNAGKTMISPQPLDVHELASNLKDLQLQQLVDFSAKEVEIAFGLPHGILQSETVNVADGQNSKNALIEFTIAPLVNETIEVLNYRLVEKYGSRLMYSAEIQLSQDKDKQATRLNTLVSGGILTINEARQVLGYPPEEGGDELRIGASPQQVEVVNAAKSIISQRKSLAKELEVQSGILTDLLDKNRKKKKKKYKNK